MVIGNFVNFMAVSRAWKMYLNYLVTGKRLVWDKTMHDFPSSDGFKDRRQRLGELLVSWQAIAPEELQKALAEEHANEAPLGRVLMAHGWLDEETLAEAIAFQADLPRAPLDRAKLLHAASSLPIELAVRYRVLPQGSDGAGHLVVLCASPLTDEALAALQAKSALPIVQRIAREGEIADGLRLLRGVPATQPEDDVRTPDAKGSYIASVPLLGDLLIERGAVRRSDFEAAMQRYRPAEHGRIGDYMVAQGVISRGALAQAIAEQERLRSEAAAHS